MTRRMTLSSWVAAALSSSSFPLVALAAERIRMFALTFLWQVTNDWRWPAANDQLPMLDEYSRIKGFCNEEKNGMMSMSSDIVNRLYLPCSNIPNILTKEKRGIGLRIKKNCSFQKFKARQECYVPLLSRRHRKC